MTQSEYIYNTETIQEQRAVVKIEINGEDWLMDWDEWKKAEEEGRDRPVIYGDKLVMVDEETYQELKKLEDWIKINKEL